MPQSSRYDNPRRGAAYAERLLMASDVAVAEGNKDLKAKVFISYSRKDLGFADRLEAALKVRGFDPLIDRTEIYAFEEWWKRIEALIARADTVVFVLSPDAVASDVALKEVVFAASLNKRFAPILYRRVDDRQVPEALAKLNFIFFDDAARFEESANQLADALKTNIGWVRQHTEFGEQARRWASASEPSGLLLRSPVLDQAERWIASRPSGAPAPTEETQRFIRRSRQGATRRRNILTGSLTAGLILAVALAGLAYWQRGIAVEQRAIAEQNETQAKDERDKATRNFGLAQETAESLVFDIARGLRNVEGMRAETVRKILETARATFEQLAASAPDDLPLQRSRSVMLGEFGDTYVTLGDLNQALQMYREAADVRERLARADPGNAARQRDLLVAYNQVGQMLEAQGDLNGALKQYRDALAIAEQLASAAPEDAGLQYDLGISHERIGGVLRSQGALVPALHEYEAKRDTVRRLLALDPAKIVVGGAGKIDIKTTRLGWQRDLSVAYQKIGEVLERQGKLADALKAHRDSLDIDKRLIATDPGNTHWQRDLLVSQNKVGHVLEQQGNSEDALSAYRDSLAIAQRLVVSDPSNTQWQWDLSFTYGFIADVLLTQGKLDEARKNYRDAISIRERMVAGDPGNAQWQQNLARIYIKLGEVLEEQDKLDEALKVFHDSLAIRERLVARDPSNTEWQRDLAVSHGEIADVLQEQKKLDAAIDGYKASLTMFERLAVSDPDNIGWLRDAAVCHGKIGNVLREQQKPNEALDAYRKVLALFEQVASIDSSNGDAQVDVAKSFANIGLAYLDMGKASEGVQELRKGRDILAQLVALSPNNAQWRKELGKFESALAKAEHRTRSAR